MAIQEWNAEAFEKGISSGAQVTVVEFYTESCPFCKRMEATLDRLAQNGEGEVFAKVNLDREPTLSTRYGIRSVPTVIPFVRGEAVGRLVGSKGYGALAELVAAARTVSLRDTQADSGRIGG